MHPHLIKPLKEIEYAYFNNTKLSKVILSNRISMDGKFHELNVFDDVTIKIALRHPNKKDFQFEQIDALILDAIGSLYDNGIYYFTTDMIIRVIYCNTHHRASSQALNMFRERIDSMLDLRIRLNIKDECSKRKSTPKDIRLNNKQYADFLPMKPIDAVFSANGKLGHGYHLAQSPLLWEYAKYVKQIIACPFDAFSSLKHHMTIESLTILRYVYTKIALMKNQNNNQYSKKICLYRIENHIEKGLFPACNLYPSYFKNWGDKQRKICRLVEEFLDSLKGSEDKQLRIKNYKPYQTTHGEGYNIILYNQPYQSYKKKENHFYA